MKQSQNNEKIYIDKEVYEAIIKLGEYWKSRAEIAESKVISLDDELDDIYRNISYGAYDGC